MRKRKAALATKPEPTIDPSQLQCVSIPEVARLLSIGRTTVYSLINEGVLPVVKINNATRIKLASVQKLIEANQKAAQQAL